MKIVYTFRFSTLTVAKNMTLTHKKIILSDIHFLFYLLTLIVCSIFLSASLPSSRIVCPSIRPKKKSLYHTKHPTCLSLICLFLYSISYLKYRLLPKHCSFVAQQTLNTLKSFVITYFVTAYTDIINT